MGHHYIPQWYLRNFGIPSQPDFIWLYEKHGGPARRVPIAGVAQAKRFYSPQTEGALARHVEPAGNAVIQKLMSETPITPVERLQLAFYIGVMMKRVPARRRRAAEMIPGVLADVVSKVREELEVIANTLQADPELLARRLQEVNAAEKKIVLQPPPEVLAQIHEPWPSEGMLHALFGMAWRVMISPGPQYFITTDNPAFFFRSYGLGTKESELSFPLSTTHALHGSWQETSSRLVFLRATPPLVKEINRRLASETERLAFYHEPALWLPKVLAKKNPYLSVIRW